MGLLLNLMKEIYLFIILTALPHHLASTSSLPGRVCLCSSLSIFTFQFHSRPACFLSPLFLFGYLRESYMESLTISSQRDEEGVTRRNRSAFFFFSLHCRCVLQSQCARGNQPGQWLWSFDMEQQCLAIQELSPSNISREESRTVSLQEENILTCSCLCTGQPI